MAGIISQDALFRYLVKFSIVENFYKRAQNKAVRDGEENHDLVAPAIIRDMPTIKAHIKQALIFRPLDNMRQMLVDEAKRDGAYVMEGRTISNKVFIQNLVQSVLHDPEILTVENLQKKYLPEDFLKHHSKIPSQELIGTRTQNALCAGLKGGRGYLLKQTAYGNAGVGKVCLFDHTGLKAEFILEREYGYLHPTNAYYHPLKRVVGVLRQYENKEREESLITPEQLGISVNKHLNMSTKLVTNVNGWFKFVQLGV